MYESLQPFAAHQQPQQRSERRPSLITKLPRQAEMDDHTTSAPLEPRKSRGTTSTSVRASPRSPFLEISPIERRSESPPSPQHMAYSPERRKSPVHAAVASPLAGGDPSEDESIALARMLMAEEAMESYALSNDYLRYNSGQYSQEDLEALQAAIEDESVGEEEGGETNDIQYEMMLRLGEAIGDVKQERWKMVSEDHISSLPMHKFVAKDVNELDVNDSRCKCLVCQFSYEEGDNLRNLPCGHCFHAECVDQWLKDKDCCAYCRQPIVNK